MSYDNRGAKLNGLIMTFTPDDGCKRPPDRGRLDKFSMGRLEYHCAV